MVADEKNASGISAVFVRILYEENKVIQVASDTDQLRPH